MDDQGEAWEPGRGSARRLPSDLFRFTTGERSEVYTAVLQVFGEADERLETALGLDDVGRRLSGLGRVTLADKDALFDVLRQLREWRPGGPGVGRVSDVPWDGELTARLRQTGRAVTEEAVIDVLLEDLTAVAAPGTG